MPTFLRVTGGMTFLVMLFLPSTACSCGLIHSLFKRAAHANDLPGIGLFLAALALGAFAVLWPLFTERIEEWGEMLVMGGSVAALGLIVWNMVDLSRQRLSILWPVGVMILAAVLMFLGSLERYKNRKRWA